MNQTAFWKLIDETRPAKGKPDKHLANLRKRLAEMPPKEIASFEKHVLDRMDEAYDARLLEVLWILSGGGPGDDSLHDFWSWLILQGKTMFQQVLKTPHRLPELIPPRTDMYWGGLSGVARQAFEDLGRDDFDKFYESLHGDYRPPAAPHGAKLDPRCEPEEVLEKRLRKKYPDLWKHEAEYD